MHVQDAERLIPSRLKTQMQTLDLLFSLTQLSTFLPWAIRKPKEPHFPALIGDSQAQRYSTIQPSQH